MEILYSVQTGSEKMKRSSFRKIESWDQAEKREIKYYQKLTPRERFDIARALIRRAYGPESEWTEIRSVPPEKVTSYD